MAKQEIAERVTVDPDSLVGKRVIRITRSQVEFVLDLLVRGARS